MCGMGLTIRGKFKGSQEWDMGYITFGLLRIDLAHAINEEYGDHYQDMYYHPRGDWSEYNKKTAALEKKLKLRIRATDFLWMSDCEGKLSPMKCKALLDQIQNFDSKTLYGYIGRGIDQCMTITDFKNLLNECFSRRCYMVWS